MNMQDDTEFETHTISQVETAEGGWVVTVDDGGCLFVTGEQESTPPAVGESARFYGRGFGYIVRGVVIGGRVYRYQSAEACSASQAKQRETHEQDRREAFARGREAFDARVAALPSALKQRMEGFLATSAEWGPQCGPYELFCCEEAAKIAEALKTSEAVHAFYRASSDAQRSLVPSLAFDEHSGNTFGAAAYLARVLLSAETTVPRQHAAMCPLLGCADAGCWAGRPVASAA